MHHVFCSQPASQPAAHRQQALRRLIRHAVCRLWEARGAAKAGFYRRLGEQVVWQALALHRMRHLAHQVALVRRQGLLGAHPASWRASLLRLHARAARPAPAQQQGAASGRRGMMWNGWGRRHA